MERKYLTSNKGYYNVHIYECDEGECNATILDNIPNNIAGFSNSGKHIVIECPKCFVRWWFHARGTMWYRGFLDAIKQGTQKHFNR